MFCVKGEDLLFLDQPNIRLDDDLRAEYAELGLPAEPFASVGFFAPPIPDDLTGRPNVTGRTSGVEAFWWTLAEFCARRAAAVRVRRRRGRAQPVHDGGPPGRRPAAAGRRAVRRRRRGAASTATVLAPTRSWSTSSSTGSPTTTTRPDWAGPVTGVGTINAFIRRLRSSLRPLGALIRADLPDTPAPRQISTENQQVTVVDLHNLPERAQRFVVGVVLAAETARKEAAGPGGLLFTMIDELNKYAPREGN